MRPTVPSPMRHVIFFGETGSGKSSVINLLRGVGDARVSNDTRPCTQVSASYETSLYGRKYCLWDTRGLGEGRNFFRAIWGGGSEKELKKFLKERHRKHEIDLLVYCVQGSRATNALVKNYNNFCTISRRLAAPVAIVVTRLEKENNMEDWWRRNASALRQLKMDFDAHACITAFTGPYQAESKEKLVHLITGDYGWEPKESGSYFGSPVQISTPSAPSHHEGWMIRNLFRSRYRDNINDGSLHPRQRNDSSPSTAVSSTRDSDYYSTKSAMDSELPTPTIVPPTPRSATLTDILPINVALQTSSEDISSIGSSPNSMFRASSSSSHTSQSESSTEGFEGSLDDLSIPNLTSTVKRRRKFATYYGYFGDVWECDLLSEESSRKVAVKAVRTKLEERENHLKKLRRELRIWWGLSHRNIVPLLGVVSGFGHLPSMVSPWFSNGSLHKHLTDHHMLHPSERRCLLRDIATGLSYLHSKGIIHGDLHSGNVLVDDDGIACLTDFGLSFVDDFVRTSYLKSSICGNVVFADPALVKRVSESLGIIHPTKSCDVYSFGGLMLHVLSGKKPYDEIDSGSIHQTVLSGQRPQIPSDITSQDELLIRSCWDHVECNRPSAVTLLPMFQVDRQHKHSW